MLASWDAGAVVLIGTIPRTLLTLAPASALHLADGLVAMAGSWSVDGSRFTPRFPPTPGLELVVLERTDDGWRECARLTVPSLDSEPTTTVEAIEPDVDTIPANLLRFVVTFSAPMDEGSAAGHIQLLDESGGILPGTLLEYPELWDRDRRRLTILLEPGRIKRGLQPHLQAGPPAREGESVMLVVGDRIRDAAGLPLTRSATRGYRVGPPVRSRIDPSSWIIRWPASDFDPIVVRFDRPLDRSLVRRYLRVYDVGGSVVPGATAVGTEAMDWVFTPSVAGTDWELRVGARLEDLAGNSVRRVFDRDLEDPADAELDAEHVVLRRE